MYTEEFLHLAAQMFYWKLMESPKTVRRYMRTMDREGLEELHAACLGLSCQIEEYLEELPGTMMDIAVECVHCAEHMEVEITHEMLYDEEEVEITCPHCMTRQLASVVAYVTTSELE